MSANEPRVCGAGVYTFSFPQKPRVSQRPFVIACLLLWRFVVGELRPQVSIHTLAPFQPFVGKPSRVDGRPVPSSQRPVRCGTTRLIPTRNPTPRGSDQAAPPPSTLDGLLAPRTPDSSSMYTTRGQPHGPGVMVSSSAPWYHPRHPNPDGATRSDTPTSWRPIIATHTGTHTPPTSTPSPIAPPRPASRLLVGALDGAVEAWYLGHRRLSGAERPGWYSG